MYARFDNSIFLSILTIIFLKSKEYIKKNRKGTITPEKKQKIKKRKIYFLRVTSRVLCPNFKSLAQTVSPVAMTHTHTHTYSHRPNTEEIFFYF